MIHAKTKQRWLAIRPEGPAAERGFTLLEVLVTIAILGVIVVPLAQTLIAGFKVTAQVQDNVSASINRDQLASRFTNDVAEVDAAGYSTGANSCTTPTAVSSDKLIFTLNSTKLNSGGTRVIKRVSYWTVGSGLELSIVRRQCDSVTAGSPNATGVETIVAKDIGADEFATRANTIYENIATSTGGVTFCDEFRCSMQIASVAPRSTTITAQRRVFGAGVPLQVGRLYSSSKSDNASTGVAYENFTTAGASAGTERTFPNLLSLPPGLDGSDSLTVYFEVKQVTTGMWLADDRSGFTKTEAQHLAQGDAVQVAADPPSVANGQSWTLPLPVGAGKLAAAGGEYQIFTALKETGQPAKKYGGTRGFPFWLDWKPTDSIFVKAGAPGCGDPVVVGGFRGTADASGVPLPVCTLAQGLAASVTLGKPNILVNNAATYTEDIQFTASTYANNRAIVGGLNDSWLRLIPTPSTGAGLTKLTGTTGTGLLINGRTGIRIRQMDINSGTIAGAPKATSYYGARVINSSWAWFERSRVTAETGVAGADATTAGTDRGESCWGKDAVQYSTSTNSGIRNIGSNCTGSRQAASSVRQGGDGGAGGGEGGFFNSGGDGTVGQKGGGTVQDGGTAGTRGRGGYCATPHPEPSGGGGGGAGGVGGNGALAGVWLTSVATAPTAAATGFTPGRGLSGSTGSDGRGGGGAGGAGGTYCAGGAKGGAGATGGEGGQAGTGGEGGQGGGGSFGLYLGGLSTVNMGLMRIDNSTLKGNQGGTGGAGQRGGNGGQGGRGGQGAEIQDKGGDASGGGGGGGGSGGGGGAGGPGGPSLGLYSTTDLAGITRTSVTYQSAQIAGGPGGAAGARGSRGVGGAAKSNCYFVGIGGLEGWVCDWFGTEYHNYPGQQGADADLNPLAAQGVGATGIQFPNCKAWKGGTGGSCDVP